MELSEVIFDLNLKGSRSHRDYNSMVNNWYVEENNPIPTFELCLETWNNVSLIRLREQRKLERILEVKQLANLELLKTDWKIIKQQELNYLSQNDFENLKLERQNIREKSNQIESEIMNLETLELVNNYQIEY